MKAEKGNMLDRSEIIHAFVKAIEFVGVAQFKKASFFGSNDTSMVRKNESLAA